jgi:16S rRNA G1207 methylase RsmC
MMLPDTLTPETQKWLNELRKDIQFNETLRGQPLSFCTTWGLFSPKGIDEGSRLLLDYIEIEPGHNSADLGCGYGPLGLTLARLAPQGQHTLLDKDFMAVEYSRKNAALNHIGNAEILLSNGFDHLDQRRFNIIVSNLPAKTGKEQYYLYFYEALARLEPNGRFYVVTINGLREFIKKSFMQVFGNYKKLKQGRAYTVAVASKKA